MYRIPSMCVCHIDCSIRNSLIILVCCFKKSIILFAGTKLKAPDKNKLRSLGEQAMLLHFSRDRHVALYRTVETMQVQVARNMVMRALSLLCVSGSSCKLSTGM